MVCLVFRNGAFKFAPMTTIFRGWSSLKSTIERKPIVIAWTPTPERKRQPLVIEAPLDIGTAWHPNPKGSSKPKVLFVLGGPGAGKGTQCTKLSEEYGLSHISAGDCLREEVASGSSMGAMISGYIKEGKIVPVSVTVDLLRKKIENTACNRFLIDGFPRNAENMQGWNDVMSDVCDLEGVMFIDCPEEKMEKRLLSRGLTSGRTDDNIESARKRFRTYNEDTMPVVDRFEAESKLVRIAGDQSVDDVYREMQTALGPFIEKEIVDLTGSLLDAISAKDWFAYSSMCRLERKADFHKFMIDFHQAQDGRQDPLRPTSASAQLREWRPVVRAQGHSAVISYQREGCEESRVWQLAEGQWRMVQCHRGPRKADL
jgi:UMP-CMP kinase